MSADPLSRVREMAPAPWYLHGYEVRDANDRVLWTADDETILLAIEIARQVNRSRPAKLVIEIPADLIGRRVREVDPPHRSGTVSRVLPSNSACVEVDCGNGRGFDAHWLMLQPEAR